MGSCCVPSLFTTDWPEAAMRGHSMALSGLRAALLMMVVAGVVQAQDYSGTMQCQCECASDCTSGDSVTCDCPEPAYACDPGFTQVCPLDAGACPAGMSPKCPGGGAPPTTTTTTTTTPAPPALVTEQFDIGQVKCEIPMQDDRYLHGRLQLCHKGGSQLQPQEIKMHQGCQCRPDFLISGPQAVPASHSADYTCACLPD